MINMKDFMSIYMLSKVKVETQQQALDARWKEPVRAGLQQVLQKQMGSQQPAEQLAGGYNGIQEQ